MSTWTPDEDDDFEYDPAKVRRAMRGDAPLSEAEIATLHERIIPIPSEEPPDTDREVTARFVERIEIPCERDMFQTTAVCDVFERTDTGQRLVFVDEGLMRNVIAELGRLRASEREVARSTDGARVRAMLNCFYEGDAPRYYEYGDAGPQLYDCCGAKADGPHKEDCWWVEGRKYLGIEGE